MPMPCRTTASPCRCVSTWPRVSTAVVLEEACTDAAATLSPRGAGRKPSPRSGLAPRSRWSWRGGPSTPHALPVPGPPVPGNGVGLARPITPSPWSGAHPGLERRDDLRGAHRGGLPRRSVGRPSRARWAGRSSPSPWAWRAPGRGSGATRAAKRPELGRPISTWPSGAGGRGSRWRTGCGSPPGRPEGPDRPRGRASDRAGGVEGRQHAVDGPERRVDLAVRDPAPAGVDEPPVVPGLGPDGLVGQRDGGVAADGPVHPVAEEEAVEEVLGVGVVVAEVR